MATARAAKELAKLAELYPSRFVLVGLRPLKVGIRADIMTLHPELDWQRSVGRSATIRVVTPTWRRRSRVQRGSTRLAMSRTRKRHRRGNGRPVNWRRGERSSQRLDHHGHDQMVVDLRKDCRPRAFPL